MESGGEPVRHCLNNRAVHIFCKMVFFMSELPPTMRRGDMDNK